MDHKKIDYNDFDYNASYEGYIWMSDSNKPDILLNSALNKEKFELGNPFVIEGLLYDDEHKLSYNIRYVDGKYFIQCFHVTDEDLKKENCKEYISNRIDGKKLRMVQRWVAIPDEFCNGMDALQPAERIFIGFGETINEED
jgi:CRISPR type III-associated protein (TIGR04423 family)